MPCGGKKKKKKGRKGKKWAYVKLWAFDIIINNLKEDIISIEFDNKFIKFNKWYKQHRNAERDTGKDIKFLHDALDRTIELLECADKDLRSYEGRGKLLTWYNEMKRRNSLIRGMGTTGSGLRAWKNMWRFLSICSMRFYINLPLYAGI